MQVAVLQEAAQSSPGSRSKLTVTIDGRPPLKTNLLMFTPKGSKERVYLLNMPSADFASVRQAKTLSLRSRD